MRETAAKALAPDSRNTARSIKHRGASRVGQMSTLKEICASSCKWAGRRMRVTWRHCRRNERSGSWKLCSPRASLPSRHVRGRRCRKFRRGQDCFVSPIRHAGRRVGWFEQTPGINYAGVLIAWPINVLPSDHMAPGTRSLPARTDANPLTIQSQSASERTNAGNSLIVWLV